MAETMRSSKQQIRESSSGGWPACSKCAARAYQLVGAVGAPVKALDNLAAAACGKPMPHATFLPVSAADCDEFAGGRGA